MADPVMRARCPKAGDGRTHLAVDVHQPVSLSKMVDLMRVLSKCSCGAEMLLKVPKEEKPDG